MVEHEAGPDGVALVEMFDSGGNFLGLFKASRISAIKPIGAVQMGRGARDDSHSIVYTMDVGPDGQTIVHLVKGSPHQIAKAMGVRVLPGFLPEAERQVEQQVDHTNEKENV